MGDYEDWLVSESRAWLEHVRGIWRDLAAADDTLEVVRRLQEPGGVDYSKPHVRSSPNGDVMAEVVAATTDLMERWRDRRMELMAEQEDARRVIFRLSKPLHRQILLLRYVNDRGWDEIAETVCYSKDYCFEVQRAAMAELHRYLPDGWRTDIPRSTQ